MRILLIISLVFIFMCGCSITTTIKKNEKIIYEVTQNRGSNVSFEDGHGVKITSDDRGHKSGFLLVPAAILNKTPDISIEQDD